MEIVFGIISEGVFLFSAMALYLLFGFFCAGLIYVLIDRQTIIKHIGGSDMFAVVKAALFGIPLPLCSCGVIPVAVSLKRGGAGTGAVTAFLITTPATGVDSILATYALLGPFFTLYRIVATFVSGLWAGLLMNMIYGREKRPVSRDSEKSAPAAVDGDATAGLMRKSLKVLHYAFVELLDEVRNWLIIGILIGAVITYLIPDDFFQSMAAGPFVELLIMLAVGIPLYVCATGSIPIAAALMMKGMSPGAAFVFLVAGPATNAVTITVIARELGRRAVVVYVSSIAVVALAFGWGLNAVWDLIGGSADFLTDAHNGAPAWVENTFAVVLAVLLLWSVLKSAAGWLRARKAVSVDSGLQIPVTDISCQKCVMKISGGLQEAFNLKNVAVDRKKGLVTIPDSHGISENTIKEKIKELGYTPR